MFAIVRLRGEVNVRPEIKDTLQMLRIHRVNHCVVVNEDPHLPGHDPEGQGLRGLGQDRR